MNTDKVRETSKINSFFRKIFDNKLFSFYSDPLLHSTVNHAKIYNNYQNVFEIVSLSLQSTLFNKTNQTQLNNVFVSLSVITIVSNFIINQTNKLQWFKYKFIVSTLISIGLIVSAVFVISKYQGLNKICGAINDFYSKQNVTSYQSQDVCTKINNLFIVWISLAFFFIILRIVGMGLAFRAFYHLKSEHEKEQTKLRRKYRYSIMYKKKKKENKAKENTDRKL